MEEIAEFIYQTESLSWKSLEMFLTERCEGGVCMHEPLSSGNKPRK